MALEATHIRFALDIKDKYQVRDLKEYLSGSIYPDSRYTTGTDRTLTHFNGILDPGFANDDFHKGWQAHFICDKILNVIMNEKFEKEKFPLKDWHIFASAIKTILDMNDIKQFDIMSYTKYIKLSTNPNNENIKTLEKYYQAVFDLYNIDKPSLNDYYAMWQDINIGNKFAEEIKLKTTELLKDKEIVKKIKSIYKEMVNNYQTML